MFDKFGELDSYTELNALAENLFNEGDHEGIRVVNAVDRMMGED